MLLTVKNGCALSRELAARPQGTAEAMNTTLDSASTAMPAQSQHPAQHPKQCHKQSFISWFIVASEQQTATNSKCPSSPIRSERRVTTHVRQQLLVTGSRGRSPEHSPMPAPPSTCQSPAHKHGDCIQVHTRCPAEDSPACKIVANAHNRYKLSPTNTSQPARPPSRAKLLLLLRRRCRQPAQKQSCATDTPTPPAPASAAADAAAGPLARDR